MDELYKLSGAGNDFLAMVEPANLPEPALIAAICRRGLSLGADGLLVLRRQPGGIRLVYHNEDGGRADLCLNGSRAAAQLAFCLGLCPPDQVLALETDVGVLACRRRDATWAEVALPPRLVGPASRIALRVGDTVVEGWYAKAGVPHVVLLVEGPLAAVPLSTLAPPLRRHADLGPGGANVSVARVVAPDRLEIRSFERGIEGETLACGSGICCSVRVGLEARLLDAGQPIQVLTAGGCELRVEVADGEDQGWTMAGDARLVARCRLEPGALVLPPAARFRS